MCYEMYQLSMMTNKQLNFSNCQTDLRSLAIRQNDARVFLVPIESAQYPYHKQVYNIFSYN